MPTNPSSHSKDVIPEDAIPEIRREAFLKYAERMF
jgi:hypothetical protein